MSVMKSREFSHRIGVSIKTLERLEKKDKVVPIRRNGIRYYTEEMVNEYLGLVKISKVERKVIAYYRVSTNSQKKEMKYQRESIEAFSISSGTAVDEYLYDIASGINFKRKNFLKLIDMIERGEIEEIIVTYKDRLTRFGFELIEERCKVNNTKLTVINLERSSPEKELVEDLMTIIHVFSSRLYGLRKYKKKIKDDLNDSITQDKDLS